MTSRQQKWCDQKNESNGGEQQGNGKDICVYEPSKTIQFTFWSSGDSYFALGDFPLVRFIDDDVNLRGDE